MRRASLAAAVLLAGCAAIPSLPPGSGEPAEARLATLQAREYWQLAGRVAIAAGGEGASASLDWRQQGASSELTLRGPLGTGSLQVRVDGDRIAIDDGASRFEGDAARSLLQERLGAEVPVRQLRFWVLGVPAPGTAFAIVDDPGGLPATLTQDGWTIGLERYRAVGPDLLPALITLQQGTTRLRLAVSRWDFPP